MGRPFDKKTQTSLLKEGLTLLRDIRVPGTLVDLSDRYRLYQTPRYSARLSFSASCSSSYWR